jgi:hypothetical protein
MFIFIEQIYYTKNLSKGFILGTDQFHKHPCTVHTDEELKDYLKIEIESINYFYSLFHFFVSKQYNMLLY